MAECIYCRDVADEASFSRPEHVLPKAFGRFRQNLTIFDVCKSCNQWFGDTLDHGLGRNSGEAVLRLLFGVKPPQEGHEVGGHRVLARYFGENDVLRGSEVTFTATADGALVSRTAPQVGFQPRTATEKVWFLESELTAENVVPYRDCPTWTVGGDEEDWERIEQRLVELGVVRKEVIAVRPDTEVPLQQVKVRIDYAPDTDSLRAVSKIAFNYLCSRVGPDFCLHSDFDPIRSFIRAGHGEPRSFIDLKFGPLLLDEKRFGGKQTRGHLLAIDWHPRSHAAPIGIVKLFNDIRYEVRFSPATNQLWREIKGGHHFNLRTMTVEEIMVARFPPY